MTTSFRPEDLGPGGAYHFLNSVIGPRPIAWVSTVAPDGTFNVAPHSYTTVVSPSPPMVAFVSVGRKDTLRNAEASGEFVYNIGGGALVERINRSAADFPRNVSEFEWAGLTPVPSERVAPPRVGEAPVAMEATVVDIYQVKGTENFMVIGQVRLIHLDPSITVDGRVDAALLDPVGRLAGSEYARLGEVFSLERPTYRGLIAAGEGQMGRVGAEDPD